MADTYAKKHDYEIVYVYSIDDGGHDGAYKIGKASIKLTYKEADLIDPTGSQVMTAAKERIKHQMSQVATLPTIHHAELTRYINEDGEECSFTDDQLHSVLEQNGFKKKDFPDLWWKPRDWMECTLDDILLAIKTIKSGHQVMPKNKACGSIVFREEQERAINNTIERFKVVDKMLWNAKMRFGKTLCSLELIRRYGFKKTLIVTHRPVVRDGWFGDYELLDFTGYSYGCKEAETTSKKNVGETFVTLQRDFRKHGINYIYFASMQDLRGGDNVKEGGIDKNHEIFKNNWDLIIVDEAHEGTQTALGKNVLDLLISKHPKVLYLSGTPYNILHLFEEENIFTWDYNMEQDAKEKWYSSHPHEDNPYEELPRLNIRTFKLGDEFQSYYNSDEEFFNFSELFRTWEGNEAKDGAQLPSPAHVGRFVHEQDVRDFLDLMHKPDSLYPFSTEGYRYLFAHTFWVLPGIKAAKALSKLLQEQNSWWQQKGHEYAIVNVAGEGDDPTYDRLDTKKHVEEHEKKEKDALEKVKKAIKKHPRTITLSCGRLTTGVTVKPWTGVFMLKGNGETKASFYMQTIFRAQSPNHEPYLKTDCYAFDFAPDRTLTVINEYLASQPNNRDRHKRPKETVIEEFLRFCSVVSIEGNTPTEYRTDTFISQVNQAYKDYIVRNGFKGRQLYVDLYQISDADRLLLEEVRSTLKGSKAKNGSDGKVTIANGGVTITGGKKKNIFDTPVTKQQKTDRKKQRDAYQAILDTLSIRLPMMVFGELESLEHFSMEAFVDGIHEDSWSIFMPKGITKDIFRRLLHLYNTDAILASFQNILERAHRADQLPVAERAKEMAHIISQFRFPDKETVLTPWQVVNMHMTDTIGGYDFYDETHSQQLAEPRFAPKRDITDEIFADSTSHVLEINAKSGVYPLWLAYTFFRYKEKEFERQHGTPPNEIEQVNIWQAILRNNIFVLCMSPMAVKITERALRGYHDYQTNCKYQPRLLEILKNEEEQKKLVKRLKKYSYWGIANMEPNKFEFKAVVGNPPYQEGKASDLSKANSAFASAVYPKFIDVARALNPKYISLIAPSRWLTKTGQGVSNDWVESLLNSNQFHLIHDYLDASECFQNVEIKGGVNYFLLSPVYNGTCHYYLHKNGKIFENVCYLNEMGTGIVLRDEKAQDILEKIKNIEGDYFEHSFAELVGPQHFFDKDGLLTTSWNGYAREYDGLHNIKYYLNKSLEASGVAWIKLSDIPKNKEVIPLHKVYLPKVGGTGNDPNVLGRPFYGEPNSVCSQTYLVIGYDPIKHNFTQDECNRVILYIRTKFFRYIVSIRKRTQDNPSSVFQFVPLQDFTSNNDIDWSKSVADIDRQLYAKYNLSEKEISFIEEMINPMD